MRFVHARWHHSIDMRDRYARPDQIEITVDRGLKSGKYDTVVISAATARRLAMQLLVAAEQSEGQSTDAWASIEPRVGSEGSERE